jgi:hypothetical protein
MTAIVYRGEELDALPAMSILQKLVRRLEELGRSENGSEEHLTERTSLALDARALRLAIEARLDEEHADNLRRHPSAGGQRAAMTLYWTTLAVLATLAAPLDLTFAEVGRDYVSARHKAGELVQ